MPKFPPPLQGISQFTSFADAPELTSEHLSNVRPIDVLEKRLRIGQRPGIEKWDTTQVGGVNAPVVAITSVSTVV